MTDINSVAQQQKQNNISSSTKVTLESLGVNISSVSSESEAKALIEKLKAAKAGNQPQGAEEKKADASETETLADAKALANKMGLVLNNNTSADEVLRQITNKIRAMAASENPSERQMAQAYQAQLTTITNSYQAIQASQNNMYSAMDMMSINNKYSLNL